MTIKRSLPLLGVLGLGVVIGAAGVRLSATAQAQEQRGGAMLDGNILITGLQQVPGCLGVEAGGFSNGKQTIIAWFDGKKAVLDWYFSAAHEGVITQFVRDGEFGAEPLTHVPDDVGPMMVMATLTPATKEEIELFAMPISQISIELYKPLPGGVFFNGRLAPEGFIVPHIRDYSR